MPTALSELKAIQVFARRPIAQAIEEQLMYQPMLATRKRKLLAGVQPSLACEPPIWELRVGS